MKHVTRHTHRALVPDKINFLSKEEKKGEIKDIPVTGRGGP
jgi:hypothetical protein